MMRFAGDICRKKTALIGLLCVSSAVCMPFRVYAQDAPARNIQINVEMRQAGIEDRRGGEFRTLTSQTQFIVVMEGAEGRIFVGERVPYVTFYRDYLMQEGYLVGDVIFQDVGTSLVVTARLVGGEVEVTLTPEISYEVRGSRERIAVQKMSTTVRVPEGQSIEIGGNVTRSEFERNFYRSRSGSALSIVLTPRVM